MRQVVQTELGKVVGHAGHHGDVPALHDQMAWTRLGRLVIKSEPVPFDETAFEWHRPLMSLIFRT